MNYLNKVAEALTKFNFFNFEDAVEKLISQYKKFGNLVVAVDFDDTIFNLHTNYDFTPIHDILRRCNKVGLQIVPYTARNKSEFYKITEFYNDLGIEYAVINQDVVSLAKPTSGKIFYSIFLDDKCGLLEAYLILDETLKIIEKGMENKENEVLDPVDLMIEKNSYEYNVLKCVEEMSELSEVLVKTITKDKNHKPENSKIIEEIGDVIFRLKPIVKIFGQSEVDIRVSKKLQSILIREKTRTDSNLNLL